MLRCVSSQICKHVCKEERHILNTAQVVKDDHIAQFKNIDSGKGHKSQLSEVEKRRFSSVRALRSRRDV